MSRVPPKLDENANAADAAAEPCQLCQHRPAAGRRWCQHCVVERCVGEGSYGHVFAVRLRGGRRIAIKTIQVQMEFQEFEVVHHTALVELQQCAAARGLLEPTRAWLHGASHALFVEYPLAVCDLHHFIDLQGVPSVTCAATIAKVLATTLARMHARLFMHRDVTARNVLLMQDGTPLLCDMSLVRRMWGTSLLRGCYTPKVTATAYRAPEVLAGKPPVYGAGVDVWGVGCIVMELLMGELLFEFRDNDAARHMQAIIAVSGGQRGRGGASGRFLRRFAPLRVMLKRRYGGDAAAAGFERVTAAQLEAMTSFVEACLQVDPARRASASELLQHDFCKLADTRALHAKVQDVSAARPAASPASGGAMTQILQHNLAHSSRLTFCPPPPVSRSDLMQVRQHTSLRVRMAHLAARLLWPARACSAMDKPAAWCSFATAMHMFDMAVALGDTRPHLCAIVVLASQREGRLHSVRARMRSGDCPGPQPLRDAVLRMLKTLHCCTNPMTLVDAVLAADAPLGDACVVAAAYASMSPQLLAPRSTRPAYVLQLCKQRQRSIMHAFSVVTGLQAASGQQAPTGATAMDVVALK